jgi:DNA repair and recombination protein RAD54 and RAD54-like protein
MLRAHAPTQRSNVTITGGGVELRKREREESKASGVSASDAMAANCAYLVRAPLFPFLTVPCNVIYQPFKSPLAGYALGSDGVDKRLGISSRSLTPYGKKPLERIRRVVADENIEPLILWMNDDNTHRISVDPRLLQFLRPHQREGLQFTFDCVMGLRLPNDCAGCILADDMGLGKTFQAIALLWTVLTQSFSGNGPTCARGLVVCPASLVNNWRKEIEKWIVHGCNVYAVSEGGQDYVRLQISNFLRRSKSPNVMIMSYETFRMYVDELSAEDAVGIVVADEAHRLKNDKTLTAQAIQLLPTRRRVLLSGTPIQNDLDEFYSMINVCNPTILGDPSHFRRHYAMPILAAREPDASDKELEMAGERLRELSTITNMFILRRTNTILSGLLPPKAVQVVFCPPTDIQYLLYETFLQSKMASKLISGKNTDVLPAINALMKLCNSPLLVYTAGDYSEKKKAASFFDECQDLFPDCMTRGRGAKASMPFLSGKLRVAHKLLCEVRATTTDKFVIVSNYTQTLGLFEMMCRENGWSFLRLDGATTVKKRQKLVDAFNDPASDHFLFLLSSKAGGCGINLIGANRLILYDPDWNPANDKQAMARVWREGQKKKCYIYRFVTTGTIEEKIFQRQLAKDGLSNQVVNDAGDQTRAIASEILKDLFTLNKETISDTHEKLLCDRCTATGVDGTPLCEQEGFPPEDKLLSFGHTADIANVADVALRSCAEYISFLMTLEVDGRSVNGNDNDGFFQMQVRKKSRYNDLDSDFEESDHDSDWSGSEEDAVK